MFAHHLHLSQGSLQGTSEAEMAKFRTRKFLLTIFTFSVVLFLCFYKLDMFTVKIKNLMMPEKCAEELECHVANIYFLRLSKSGSSTLYTILARYAWKWNLTAATYIINPMSSEPNVIMDNIVPPFKDNESMKYNMILEHSTYRRETIEKVLQSPRSYVTMVRNPLSRLESYLRFFNLVGPLNLEEDRPAESFINKLDDIEWIKHNADELNSIYTFARRLFNLEDLDENNILSEIEKTFFVGITDFYDESLILLRHRLGWEFKDILYIKLNVKKYDHDIFNRQLYNRLCQWISNECLIYDYFNKSLSQKLMQPNLIQEVNHFKSVNKKIATFCSPVKREAVCLKSVNQSMNMIVEKSEWNDQFIYTYKDCVNFLISVDQFKYLLYYRQNPTGPCADFYSKDSTMSTKVCNFWNSTKDLDTFKTKVICGRP